MPALRLVQLILESPSMAYDINFRKICRLRRRGVLFENSGEDLKYEIKMS